VEFAYIDESGDTGPAGTRTFTLGCVLVPVDDWFVRFDQLVEMRRALRDTYHLPMRQETKANHLVGVKRIYRDLGLGDGQVRDIYQRHMHVAARIASGVFAIVVRKDRVKKPELDIFDMAWRYLLERLRKRSEESGTPIMVIHDIGQDDTIRKLVRRFRRITWSASGKQVAAHLIVEDPVPRNSQHSYFIQLADLAAYAASAKALPRSGRTASICNEQMWKLLEPVHVTKVSGRGDGLYVFPAK
jgi:hypothetical protein